ncbi:MAG: N-formylglutamate amidohydrolase [Desulfopila sp.]|jgi:formiminoglutamase|nr:N-formylglutamate amidohydrolase [Desulfopila sp.]
MTKILPNKHRIPDTAQEMFSGSGRLPLLISVPHGGYTVPGAVQSRVSLQFKDIFPDSDPCTREIFDFRDEVISFHDNDIARAVIDLNRSIDDLPPHNPDGVVKSQTVMGTAVYHPGQAPDRSLIKDVLQRYYFPYHRKIAESTRHPGLLCALDCHSMLEFAPETTPENDIERPFICLSNGGDENGEGLENELSCSPDLLNLFADCLRLAFPEESDQIVLNTPFKGGYISQAHSRELPWIQFELNRRAYLQEPWFNHRTFEVDEKRLAFLRKKIHLALGSFCEQVCSQLLPRYCDAMRHPDTFFADQKHHL